MTNRAIRLSAVAAILAALVAPAAPAPGQERAAPTAEVNYAVHERGLIEVKFREGYEIRLRGGLPVDLAGVGLQSGASVSAMRRVRAGRWSRALDVSEETLDDLRARGEARSGRRLGDLNLFYRLEVPVGMSEIEALEMLRQLPEVEAVYPVPQPPPLPLPPDYRDVDDDNFDPVLNRNVYQRYLDAAPFGIDARHAWTNGGGTASGIKICDVEYDFNQDHADLPDVTWLGPNADPDNPAGSKDHGTAVLSELASLDNGFGTTGIAHGADLYFASSRTTSGFNVASAITRCTGALDAGDVILIEQQTPGPNAVGGSSQVGLVPVEWVQSNYTAIQTAVANGIVVVEAAGNGGEDLDDPDYSPSSGAGSHKPFLAANDSGAIIVGAAGSPYSGSSRTPAGFTCYGSTVDLHAWGGDIVAAGYGTYYSSDGEDLEYLLSFGGTSGASPMVTGAAAIASAIWQLADGSPATPSQIKELLRDTGTPQLGAGNIGPMPDLEAAIADIWGSALPDPPSVTPSSGSYAMPLEVAIDFGPGQNGTNTNLRYTLDGSEPTPDSYIVLPDFGDVLVLLTTATVKAKAYFLDSDSGQTLVSPTTTRYYTSTNPTVADPVISPAGGNFTQPHQVTVSTSTPGATIKYRTDGKTMGLFRPGTTYAGPITLPPGTHEIIAQAFKDGFDKSSQIRSGQIVVSETILSAPTLYPDGGTFVGSATVYLSTTVLGAEVRYTLDGTTPGSASPVFNEPILLESSATLKARTFLSGFTPSPTTSASFTVQSGPQAPVLSPAGTSHTGSVSVTMTSSGPGAVIRYTDNGSAPQSYSQAYTTPVVLGVGVHTVNARAYLPDGAESPIASRTYTVFEAADGTVNNPTMTPFTTTTFVEPFTVTMHTDTEGADIYYTLMDGGVPADPTTGSLEYSGPFTISVNGNWYFKMRAFKSGSSPSGVVQSGQITKTSPSGSLATPTITPPGGLFHNQVSVALSEPQFENTYYTTDGTDPLDHPPFLPPTRSYSNPFNLNRGTTIRALSYRSFFTPSDIAEAVFEFQCGKPTVTPSAGTYVGSVEVSLSTVTSNATIYYTVDGSEPDESSAEYTAPFDLGAGDHAVRARCYRFNYEPSELGLAALIVEESATAPTILTQPQSQTTNAGDSVSFSIDWDGTPAPTFQWQFDGNDLAGQIEPTLDIGSVQPGNAGSYRCVASNSAGQAISDAATLTVNGTGAPAIIFIDGFESGNTSAWSLEIPSASITLEPTGSPASYSRRLGLDRSALTTLIAGPAVLFGGLDEAGELVFGLEARPVELGFELRITARQNDGSWRRSSWTELHPWERPVEVQWRRAAAGTEDGRMELWGGSTLLLRLRDVANHVLAAPTVAWRPRILTPID